MLCVPFLGCHRWSCCNCKTCGLLHSTKQMHGRSGVPLAVCYRGGVSSDTPFVRKCAAFYRDKVYCCNIASTLFPLDTQLIVVLRSTACNWQTTATGSLRAVLVHLLSAIHLEAVLSRQTCGGHDSVALVTAVCSHSYSQTEWSCTVTVNTINYSLLLEMHCVF